MYMHRGRLEGEFRGSLSSSCGQRRQRGQSVKIQYGFNLTWQRLAYDGGDDKETDRYHKTIQVPPPSRIFVLCLVHRSKSVLKILADGRHTCTALWPFALLTKGGFWG